MDAAREAARRMVRAREIAITQHGEIVDPDTFGGPIRSRKMR
jgi:hypothetical protein